MHVPASLLVLLLGGAPSAPTDDLTAPSGQATGNSPTQDHEASAGLAKPHDAPPPEPLPTPADPPPPDDPDGPEPPDDPEDCPACGMG